MKKYKIGYTTGVYDLFHIGHLNVLRNAKAQCEYLIVGVSTDDVVESYKHKRPIIPFEERIAIVEAIKYVDKVVLQDSMDKIKNVIKDCGCDKWNHTLLGCCQCLRLSKHFRICNGESQRRVLDQRDYLIGNRRQNPLDDLRKDNLEKRLRTAVPQYLGRLVLSLRHGSNPTAVDLRKIGCIIQHKSNDYGIRTIR